MPKPYRLTCGFVTSRMTYLPQRVIKQRRQAFLSFELNIPNVGIVWKKSQIEELYDCAAGSPEPRLPSQCGAIKV